MSEPPPINVVITPPTPVNVVITPGLPGATGPAGKEGKEGKLSEGSGDLHYVFTQGSPSAKWEINHKLGKYPSVLVEDSANDEIEGDIEYVNANELIITFSGSFSGKAYLN
jgi:hypothetical protein